MCFENKAQELKRWKGYSLIGQGNVCAVYSDDDRTNGQGIQHFYYNDYTADYISSTSVKVFDQDSTIFSGKKSIGMENFFTPFTKISHHDQSYEMKTFAIPDDIIVLSVTGSQNMLDYYYNINICLNSKITTDCQINLSTSKISDNIAILSWNNNINLFFTSLDSASTLMIQDSSVVVVGKLNSSPAYLLITADKLITNGMEKLSNLKKDQSLSDTAKSYWENWLYSGIIPKFNKRQYTEAFERNLYAAKASCLNGQIPADITGQFLTNNMPQLYPRDAMMVARVFLLTNHFKEAEHIIKYWSDYRIPRKTMGEWYARYDAHGLAIDAGTGARFDEPEWDANGYFIQLINMYHEKTGTWLTDSTQIYEVADFLVNQMSQNGLLFEGGIIEWSGYLPATNMTAAAALKTASKIASTFGNNLKSTIYKNASKKISTALPIMFDTYRNTYTDVRFSGGKNDDNISLMKTTGDTLFHWDTSANFGILWGYPDHNLMKLSNKFYRMNTIKQGGGVQYFDAPDAGLAGYGHDVFFFTTAAAAQYQALTGNIQQAQFHINWMLNNTNIYGLMPERIYLDGSDCSDASPLSWCCAEFAAALLELHWVSRRN